ncbi:hypothetical protein HK103_004514 [Boothiomyces macroporosus]|uniref:Raptor N-terminal CASPase-like domain-containing protein n=1 Tax=Boothiomyces macroporosus TaxID=261099 RepID=A0AAD5UJ34_9FUNG|nr:hypothetical protein HK103_004514 [Boothiomyces macroporosus]
MDEEESSQDDFQYSYYSDRRHVRTKPAPAQPQNTEWRIKEKLKTVSVSLVLCLNIGVDPPDIVKTKPCAKMECWIDPFLLPGQKALEAIGRNLQSQYEAWQPRARYRLSLDPSIEETKKLCCSLRRNAKDDRILFHYNGHGNLGTWLGSPCIYVYDCSNAGHILNAFNRFAAQRDAEMANHLNSTNLDGMAAPYTPLSQCIQLAACQAYQTLPMSPDLPADLFTSCLTTPIEIALRWFVLSNPLIKNVTLDMTNKIPGRVTDRRTPLGELNWIFTSITDTIAWSVLPTDLFIKLFRNDLMVAALFRNFLLANRIMRHYNCIPMSSPVLPDTHQHPMWEAWDLAADHYLAQLPHLLSNNSQVEYKLSTFFSDQLSAFEVWIKRGSISKEPPLQLPIVLQVLLSQVHRLRALLLLSKFLDFGKWAVDLALSVGIFPYVLKLLQSPALELRPVLVFIWAKLLAVDSSCKTDLLKDSGYTYFIGILTNTNPNAFLVPNISEHRAMCVFILSVFCEDYPLGKQACLSNDLLPALLPYLSDQDSLLRQWTCVCLCNFWTSFPDAKWAAYNANAHEQLSAILLDSVPEVRAGAVAALGALFGDLDRIEQVLNLEQTIVVSILKTTTDCSPLVRKELACALSRLVEEDEVKFIQTAYELFDDERKAAGFEVGRSSANRRSVESSRISGVQQSMHLIVWKAILTLSVDPFPEVAIIAMNIVDKINSLLVKSSMVDPSMNNWIQSQKAFVKPVTIAPKLKNIARKIQPTPTSVASGIFGMSIESEASPSLKRSSSFVFNLKALGSYIGIPSSGSVAHSETPGRPAPALSRMRPQSMYLPKLSSESKPKMKSSPSESNIKFTTPQTQIALTDIEDPGSEKYSERQWRSIRNEKLNQEAASLYQLVDSNRFEKFVAHIPYENENFTDDRVLLFHPYDPYLLSSDHNSI